MLLNTKINTASGRKTFFLQLIDARCSTSVVTDWSPQMDLEAQRCPGVYKSQLHGSVLIHWRVMLHCSFTLCYSVLGQCKIRFEWVWFNFNFKSWDFLAATNLEFDIQEMCWEVLCGPGPQTWSSILLCREQQSSSIRQKAAAERVEQQDAKQINFMCAYDWQNELLLVLFSYILYS